MATSTDEETPPAALSLADYADGRPSIDTLADVSTDALETMYDREHRTPATLSRMLERSHGIDATPAAVEDRLRRDGVLEPYDDRRALAYLFHDRGLSIDQIAETVFDGAASRETFRNRMHRFGIIDPIDDRHPEHRTNRLEELNPEDVGLSPLQGEPDAKYTRRGGVTDDA